MGRGGGFPACTKTIEQEACQSDACLMAMVNRILAGKMPRVKEDNRKESEKLWATQSSQNDPAGEHRVPLRLRRKAMVRS